MLGWCGAVVLGGSLLASACNEDSSSDPSVDAGSGGTSNSEATGDPTSKPPPKDQSGTGGATIRTPDAGPPSHTDDEEAGTTPADVGNPDGSTVATILDAGPEPLNPGACREVSDCELPNTVPEACAEALCTDNLCEYRSIDGDGDGFRAKRCTSRTPGVSVTTGDDCDDLDNTVSPNGWDGPEGDGFKDGCNDDIDQDCSGLFDDGQLLNGGTCTCKPGETGVCSTTVAGAVIDYPTLEQGKPVGACELGTRECLPNGTWGTCNGAVGKSPETCDGNDNDCDGIASVDDDDVINRSTFVCDADRDDHVAKDAVRVASCSAPASGCETGQWLTNPGAGVFDDCDDKDAQRNPDETEVCNNKDDDCDGDTDESGAIGEKYWSYDADDDHYRNQEYPTYFSCKPPPTAPAGCSGACPPDAWVDRTLAPLPTNDCDDNDSSRSPDKPDQCNGIDQNCDGSPLTGCACAPGDAQACDTHDEDGIGRCKPGKQNCSGGSFGDCLGAVGKAVERCGTEDYDCDGTIGNEDPDSFDKDTWVCDADKDGRLAISDAVSVESCLVPPSAACNAGNGDWVHNPVASRFDDCDDSDDETFPLALEICDGKDNNCNDLTDAADSLSGTPTNPGVTYACAGGKWTITQCPVDTRHCDENIQNGCETDDTALATCRSCSRACLYSCGATDCVEAAQVSAGFNHSCLIDSSGKAACFGKNTDSQLGDGGTGRQLAPRAVALLSGVSAISAGKEHTCAIAAPNQSAYCWGDDTNGELGNGAGGDSAQPQLIELTSSTSSIAAGEDHTCAVISGAVKCWGSRANGKLGDYCEATTCNTSMPTPSSVFYSDFSLLAACSRVGVGREHSCALLTNGTVACWGQNNNGQLGDGSSDAFSSTVRTVSTLTSATDLAVGDYHTCAVQGGKVFCWGKNGTRQLGQPTGDSFNTPQEVPALSGITAVNAGSGFTCALTNANTIKCWGDNSKGQTASGEGTASATLSTLSLTNVTALSTGSQHGCAVAQNNQSWCWGDNTDGQLGNGVTSEQPNPTPTTVKPQNKN